MDGIKIPVTKFEQYIINTHDHVWYGILKRSYKDKKYTLSEWREVINTLKSTPAR